jgi:hypothetical protein
MKKSLIVVLSAFGAIMVYVVALVVFAAGIF